VRAAAGENWHGLVQWTLAHGLPGLENLSLIPGSAGAAPIQNIGAYGSELKDVFHSLTAFDFDSGELLSLDRAACRFGYRDSVFKHELRDRAVILDVTFALPKQWRPKLGYAELAREIEARGIGLPDAQAISEAVIAIRRRKLPDPAQVGNAGSFFKNPVVPADKRDALLAAHPQLVSHVQPDGSYKLAAGWLIDRCGWKGRTLGAAGVYERQALVLVNRGQASGQEIASLARAIQEDVARAFGVMLEPEPVYV
jgi:UDP-N-acetylmuramate dehydrogenase